MLKILAIVTSDKNYVNNLLESLSHSNEPSPKYAQLYKVLYKEHEFMVVVTGYGKVSIGSTLRYVCEKYPIKVILCVGTAGSIIDANEIFSAVIPTSAMQFDVDFSPNGFNSCTIPKIDRGYYDTNEDLIKCLELSCNMCGVNSSKDLIASSDMFVCNYNLSNSIRRQFNVGAVDCESGCVGQFAYMNDIPYACVKVISNFANNNGIKQYNLYDDEAAIILQRIINKFLKEFYE